MAINSVSSSTSSDALAVGAKAQPDRTKQSGPAKRQPAQAGQGVTVTPMAQAEAPRPVVNAQGQQTGRIINTTA